MAEDAAAMIPLTRRTIERIRVLFPEGEHGAVERILLEQCGDNLPLVHTSYAALTERIRFAVLKLSRGRLADFERHVEVAATDWRDVLLAAGFGTDPGAHLRWSPEKESSDTV